MSFLQGINDSVVRSGTVLWKTIKSVYGDLFPYVWMSVLWWVGTLTVILAPLAHTAMHRVAHRTATYRRIESDFFYEGLRMHKGLAYLMYWGNFLGSVVILVSIWFYSNIQSPFVQLLVIPLIWVAFLFLLVTQFVFPLLWEQEEVSLALIYKNALILVLQHPLFCVLVTLFKITILFLFSLPAFIPLFLFGPAFSTVLSNYALNYLLIKVELAPPPPSWAD